MAKKVTKRDFDRDLNAQLDAQKQMIDLQKEELNTLTNILSVRVKSAKIGLDVLKAEQELNASKNAYIKLTEEIQRGQVTVGKTTLDNIKKQQIEQQKKINKLKLEHTIWTAISKVRFSNISGLVTMLDDIGDSFKQMDKPIRDAALHLGFGAEKSQLIRDAFYAATPQANILGATMQDLATVQKSYTDQSGRALALTSNQLINISEIAKGTGLASDEAGRLAAQFEMLGNDTANTHRIIQGIVDSSERMGVSSQKVLKIVGQNFSKLNTFAFKDGVNGMAKMAQYAEKFKVDISGSLESATRARSLEGAIEMASQLQILGGEFAKSDPFELFHLSRNDPAKYTQRLNEMVKGMSSLVKTADGFQIKTSPQDLDRLRIAADAMGIPFDNLVEQSQRMAEISTMNKQMMGTAFSKEDREAIQGMAKLDSKSGIYKVLGKDISKLSAQEIESLKTQQKTLKERAEAAQTFDEKFQNTINGMKSTLLPLLDGINAAFDLIHPLMKGLTNVMQKITSSDIGKTILGSVGLLAGGSFALLKASSIFKGLPFFSKGGMGGAAGGAMGGGGAAGGAMGGGGAAGGAMGGGGGMTALGKGAGVGLAAVGIGAGVGLAADGIAKLASAFKELNPDQLDALNQALKTMGIVMVGMTVGLGLVATVGSVAAPALVAIGIAAAGVGVAIGAAAWGVGQMAEGFATLLSVADPSKVLQLAAGVGALAYSMTLLAGGGLLTTLAGGGALGSLLLLSMNAGAFDRIGKAMKEINVVMNSKGEGLKELKQTLDSISNTKSVGNMISELNKLVKGGIKVEFKDKNVALNVNLTTQIDSDVIAKTVAKKIVVLQKGYQEGKLG